MAEEVGLNLLRKGLVTDQVVLTVGYDKSSLVGYEGETKPDFYGRLVPKHAHGTYNLKMPSASTSEIKKAVTEIYQKQVNPELLIRRIMINVNHVKREKDAKKELRQLGLFDEKTDNAKEKRANKAVLAIKKRYGKNAILKGINFEEGATGRERNAQSGGHRA